MLLRPIEPRDLVWLTAQGLAFSKAGHQYHWLEAPLQLYNAPMRAALGRRGPAAIIEVEGRRAGYIGRNPMSGNIEYFLAPWARGGVGKQAIGEFLAGHRPGDRARRFFIAFKNERSRRALLGAMAAIGWTEGDQFWIERARLGWHIWVKADRETHR